MRCGPLPSELLRSPLMHALNIYVITLHCYPLFKSCGTVFEPCFLCTIISCCHRKILGNMFISHRFVFRQCSNRRSLSDGKGNKGIEIHAVSYDATKDKTLVY
uniref:Uncharacterized protein n=1 Tax=Anguilla anguilla TaxID=7936 RepID=A0A0E9WZA9_ANGAN